MKICFIYDSVFRHGGVQRVMSLIINEICKTNDVYIICNQEFDLSNNVYDINLEKVTVLYNDIFQYNPRNKVVLLRNRIVNLLIEIFKSNQYLSKIVSKIYYRKKVKNDLINIINENEFDIVIGCMMHFNLLLGSIKCKLNSKVLGWEHNSYYSYFDKNRQYSNKKYFCKSLLSQLDSLMVLTNNDKNLYYENLEIDSIVLPNPLSFKSKDKSKLKNKQILIVGRLEYNKGSDILLSIIEEFCEINDDWNVRVIGEGEMYDYFIEQIEYRKLTNRVSISKFTKNISDEYINSDIYICTSRYESFGLAVLESMQYGLPIVTFNTSGPNELIDNNFAGYVIDKYNINEFVKYLNLLCRDEELRKEKSRNAIIRSEEFSLDKVINKWNKQILECETNMLN